MNISIKKAISILLIIVLIASSFVISTYAMNNEKTTSAEVIQVDLDHIKLNKTEQKHDELFREKLVDELSEINENTNLTIEDLKSSNKELNKVISDYCDTNTEILSKKICGQALKNAESKDILLDIDEEDDVYKDNTKTYTVDDNMSITFTPDLIVVDEYMEKDLDPSEVKPDDKEDIGLLDKVTGKVKDAFVNEAYAATSWKYKSVATRRTLIYKVTIKGKTYSFSVWSTHTGGQVKYNGTKATHSADYYAYDLAQAYGGPFTFKKVSKLKEAYSGTSYHYKYTGKVSGSIKIVTPVKVSWTFKEKLLGCQVITNKKGSVTKNYWPTL